MHEKFDFFKDIIYKKTGEERSCNCFVINQSNTSPTYIFNAHTRKIVEFNDPFLTLLKYSKEEVETLFVEDILVAEVQEIEGAIVNYLKKGQIQTPLRQYRSKDGEILYIESTVQVWEAEKQDYIAVTMQDVTQCQRLQNRLRLAEQVFESASDGIVVTDLEGVIQFVNPAFLQTTGYALEEVIGMTMRIVKSDKHDDSFYRNMWNLLTETGQWKGEIWNTRKNGEVCPEWIVIDAIKNELGKVAFYAAIIRDLSERMKYEEKIKYQAYHDGLTGLPNRRLFYEKIHESIMLAKRYTHMIAVMFIDLDGFKGVNDNFGHDIGDLLLQEVGKRIQDSVRETDLVARMGGDEFTLILPHIDEKEDASLVAEKLKQVLQEPFYLKEHLVTISSSIGISIFPDDGEDENLLVKKADDRMYQAKMASKNKAHNS